MILHGLQPWCVEGTGQVRPDNSSPIESKEKLNGETVLMDLCWE
jgi:hypothetical protein